MTAPLPTPVVPAAEPTGSVRVPLRWLLEHGSWPVRVRSLLELAPATDAARAAHTAVYAHEPALRLAVQQRRDGTWNDRMLGVSPVDDLHFGGVGTVPAIRRLLEYGWEPDAPPFQCAKRVLFRLLAEDIDPAFLFELRQDAGDDEYLIRRSRALLREAAAATLAQLGYEADPRLRGAAVRALERVTTYVRSVLAAQPADGSTEPPSKATLPANAAPPSMHFLVMLSYMPRFRSEHQEEITKLLTYLAAPAPSGVPKQHVGKHVVEQPHFVLGDPLAQAIAGNTTAAAVPTILAWLEVVARLGFLRRNQAWSGLLDQMLAERDGDGVWRGRAASFNPPQRAWDWPTYPLGDVGNRDHRVADATFRLALVARLSGRALEMA